MDLKPDQVVLAEVGGNQVVLEALLKLVVKMLVLAAISMEIMEVALPEALEVVAEVHLQLAEVHLLAMVGMEVVALHLIFLALILVLAHFQFMGLVVEVMALAQKVSAELMLAMQEPPIKMP
jgi:hypothetical protein